MIVQTENKLKSVGIRLLIGGLIISVMAPAYLFLTPKSYRAITRLKVTEWIHARDSKNPSNLDAAPTESQKLRADAVANEVIANLNLKEIWGKRYRQGAVLAKDEARQILRSKALIQADPKSSLIEIQVTSENPEETAAIANEMAHVYLEDRQSERQGLIRGKLDFLKRHWDEANQKLQDSLTAQAQLYFDINKSRQANHLQFYDADAYNLLLRKRAEAESDYTTEQSVLADLKKMDPEQLKQVLASPDDNSPLTPMLIQLNKAKNDLMTARLNHGPESSEVKNGIQIVAQINQRVDELVKATMTTKETEIVASKAMLDDLEQRIKHATTNAGEANAQDERYAKVSADVKDLEQQRDDLQRQMDTEAADAIQPSNVTTEIIDTAEVPSKPFVPARNVALGIVLAGSGVMVLGLLLLAVAQKRVTRN